MVYLNDLSILMQRTISLGITFMVSQSGVPNNYNLYFAKYVEGEGSKQVRLSFHENESRVIQYADEEHPAIHMESVDGVIDYVARELRKTEHPAPVRNSDDSKGNW